MVHAAVPLRGEKLAPVGCLRQGEGRRGFRAGPGGGDLWPAGSDRGTHVQGAEEGLTLPLRGPLARLVGLLTLGKGMVEPLRVLATILRQDSNTSATPTACAPLGRQPNSGQRGRQLEKGDGNLDWW